jgi:anti-sigma B factor antagonist
MEIKFRSSDNVIILDLSGRIDVNAANFIETIGQCIHDGYTDILCNLEGVEFIDYLGISAIVLAFKEVTNKNGRMKISNLATHLRSLFSVTGLDKTIEIYPEEELALNSFKEDKAIEHIKRMQLRRRFKRLPIDIKVELKNKYGSSSLCLKLDTLNMSAIGAYLYGCNKFKLGDEVILKFNLPPDCKEIEIEGKVVWLSDKQVQPHIHPGMAVEFYHISSSTQEKIFEFIERNLAFISNSD